jgi:hypothetical protein
MKSLAVADTAACQNISTARAALWFPVVLACPPYADPYVCPLFTPPWAGAGDFSKVQYLGTPKVVLPACP